MGNQACDCAPFRENNSNCLYFGRSKPKTNDIQSIDEICESMEQNIMKHFETSVTKKDWLHAMTIMEDFCTEIDFANYFFQNGDTPIHYAVRLHNIKFLYYLLQKGYNVNVFNELTKDTPLHIATKHNDKTIVAILLKHNAKTFFKNMLKKTPIDIARNYDITLVNMLSNFQSLIDKESSFLGAKKKYKSFTFGENKSNEDEMDGFVVMSEYEYSISKGFSVGKGDAFRGVLSPSVITRQISFQNSNGQVVQPTPLQRIIYSVNNIGKHKTMMADWIYKLRIYEEPKIYEKKYLFIRDYHLIWSYRRIKFNPNTKLNIKQLKKYQGYVHLFLIKSIKEYKSKKAAGYKFVIHTNTYSTDDDNEGHSRSHKHTKVYIFKCDTKTKRDEWVNHLNKYIQYLSKHITSLQSIGK